MQEAEFHWHSDTSFWPFRLALLLSAASFSYFCSTQKINKCLFFLVFFYKERQVRGLSSRRLTWRRLLEKVTQAGSKRLDRLFLRLCPRFPTAAVSNVAQLLISSQHLSSLSSSVWHPHTGGKTVSSVCLSHRKVVSGQKRRRRRRRQRTTSRTKDTAR